MSSHDKFLELFKNLPNEIQLSILTSFIQINPKKNMMKLNIIKICVII